MHPVFVHPFWLLGQFYCQINDWNFEFFAYFSHRVLVALEKFCEAAMCIEVRLFMSFKVNLAINRWRGAEDHLGADFLTSLSDRFQVLTIFLQWNKFLTIDTNVVCSEKDDNDFRVMSQHVFFDPVQTLR